MSDNFGASMAWSNQRSIASTGALEIKRVMSAGIAPKRLDNSLCNASISPFSSPSAIWASANAVKLREQSLLPPGEG